MNNAKLDAMREMKAEGLLARRERDRAPERAPKRPSGCINPPNRRPDRDRRYEPGEEVRIIGENPNRVFFVEYHHGDEVSVKLADHIRAKQRDRRRKVHEMCVRRPEEAYHEEGMHARGGTGGTKAYHERLNG